MSSTYTPSLRLELMGTGDQVGTWGTTANGNFGTLLETAVAGYTSVSVTSANQAFTANNGSTDEARNAVIALTTTTTANFAVYAPPAEKTYTIYNASAYTATIYNSTVLGNTTAAGTGVAIPAGKTLQVWSDGTNFAVSLSYLPSATTGVTQNAGDNSTKLATTAYADMVGTGYLTGIAGTANAITGTLTGVAAYAAGLCLTFIAGSTNTGATTLNVNGLGAKSVFRQATGGAAAVSAGIIQSGCMYTVRYDGTQFVIISALPEGPAFSYGQDVPQTLTSGVLTKITFASSDYDTTGGMFASSRFTPTVAGYYQLNASIYGTSNDEITSVSTNFYKNGVLWKRGVSSNGISAGGAAEFSVNAHVYLNGSTDYVEVYANFASISTITTVNANNVTYFQGALARYA